MVITSVKTENFPLEEVDHKDIDFIFLKYEEISTVHVDKGRDLFRLLRAVHCSVPIRNEMRQVAP